MAKIAIVTPVWGRPHLRDAFFGHMLAHKEHLAELGIDLSVSVAGSEGQYTMRPAVERGFNYVEVGNDPLGNKFNAAIKLANLSHDPDYYCIMGSDTFVDLSVWGMIMYLIGKGEKYIGVTDLYMVNWDGKNKPHGAVYWGGYKVSNPQRSGEPIGPLRLIHKSLLPDDLELYDPERNSNLDASATRKLPDSCTFESKPYRLVSCKEELSITPIAKFPEWSLEHHPDDMFNDLFGIK